MTWVRQEQTWFFKVMQQHPKLKKFCPSMSNNLTMWSIFVFIFSVSQYTWKLKTPWFCWWLNPLLNDILKLKNVFVSSSLQPGKSKGDRPHPTPIAEKRTTTEYEYRLQTTKLGRGRGRRRRRSLPSPSWGALTSLARSGCSAFSRLQYTVCSTPVLSLPSDRQDFCWRHPCSFFSSQQLRVCDCE